VTFSFHPEAEKEFFSAIEYYEDQEQDLGRQLSLEVMTAVANALDFPRAWSIVEDDVRRCLIHRFPFAVLYTVEDESILVLAVMHLRREPGYWRSRLD